MLRFRLLPVSLLSFLCVAFTGCGIGSPDTSVVVAPMKVGGRTMGGQQPVSGSTIQIWAVGSSGYGSASTSLGTVTSDSGGNFLFTTPVTCPTSTTQVYLTATQGNPGLTTGTNNTNLALMAALGNCGNLNSGTLIYVNELTTVAAVWALQQFMVDYAHVGASATNATGLKNAFSVANVMVSAFTGQFVGSGAPAGSVIPQSEMNTLANILASCVNTAGGAAGTSTACGNLFTVVTPSGGTAPTDTIGAALDIASNPGKNGSPFGGTSALFNLVTTSGPFQPSLSAPPNDWTIAVNIPGSGSLAFDASGDAWLSTGQELSPTGAVLGTYSSIAGTGMAIDANGNVWSGQGARVAKMPASLGSTSTFTSGSNCSSGFNPVSSIAFDATGDAWYNCNGAVYEMSSSGSAIAGPFANGGHTAAISVSPAGAIWLGTIESNVYYITGSGTSYTSNEFSCSSAPCGATYVVFDSGGNAWLAGSGENYFGKMSTTGSFTAYGGYGVGGIAGAQDIAIDGAGDVWMVDNSNLSNSYHGALNEFTNAGTAITPTLGYTSSTLSTPYNFALDGSGNVWVGNSGTSTITIFVGAAAPVVTPTALALKNGTLGTRP